MHSRRVRGPGVKRARWPHRVELEGQRVRILTQESQIGPVFKDLEKKKPNPMLLGHQDWLDGLVTAARGGEVEETNLEAIGFPVRED
jgi:hypothetical protein